jgi:hypothetical protein
MGLRVCVYTPDTTKADEESGFMGLTVVPARLKAAMPNMAMTKPATANVPESRARAGKSNAMATRR